MESTESMQHTAGKRGEDGAIAAAAAEPSSFVAPVVAPFVAPLVASVVAPLVAPVVSTAYATRWIAFLEMHGVPTAKIRTRLRAAANGSSQLPSDSMLEILAIGCEAAGDPGLAFEFGLAMKPTAHGSLTAALRGCATIGCAVTLAGRYLGVRGSPFAVRVATDGAQTVLELATAGARTAERDVAPLVDCLLAVILKVGASLVGGAFSRDAVELVFAGSERADHARVREQVGSVRFGASVHQVRFPSAWWTAPIALPVVPEVVPVRELEAGVAAPAQDWVERTSSALAAYGQGCPDLDTVAKQMRMSSRTLRRRLRQSGATFREVQEGYRRAHAISLLENTRLSSKAIARELGYANASVFTRAFVRWTGRTPGAVRNAVHGGLRSSVVGPRPE